MEPGFLTAVDPYTGKFQTVIAPFKKSREPPPLTPRQGFARDTDIQLHRKAVAHLGKIYHIYLYTTGITTRYLRQTGHGGEKQNRQKYRIEYIQWFHRAVISWR